jgi:two-component system response regulator YesN
MYKVFVVEDEIVVRESIRDNFPWDETDFTLVGEAPDGEAALPLIEELKPDILITDIKMPFMDGLELSRIVRRNMPWVKIVLISGYDEFEFAKEAIQISVTRYLLKPISSADLLETLGGIAEAIESEQAQRERVDFLDSCFRNNRQLMAERFLGDLTTGVIPSAEAIEKAKAFDINLIGRYYMVALILLEPKEEAEPHAMYGDFVRAEAMIEDFLDENPGIMRFSRNLREVALIFKGENTENLKQACYEICKSIKYEIERKTSCSLSVSIGGTRERVHGIAESFAEAENTSGYDYIYGRHKIVGYEDTRSAQITRSELLDTKVGEISGVLRKGGPEEIAEMVDDYVGTLLAPETSFLLRGYAAVDLALSVARFISELGGDPEEVLPDLDNVEEAVSSGDPARITEFFKGLTSAAADYRERCKRNKYGDIIEKARSYIDTNYASPDISLPVVAREVHMSPSHFSTIFGQEVGETFIEYLTRTRIERAKELLKTTSLRSSEIAYDVGYKDPHYFSYIFKAHTGITPTEYRER